MSLLSETIKRLGMCPLKAMDILQDFGVVSDNAVTADDVADVDYAPAIKILKLNEHPKTDSGVI